MCARVESGCLMMSDRELRVQTRSIIDRESEHGVQTRPKQL